MNRRWFLALSLAASLAASCQPAAAVTEVRGTVTAGPTCPVATDPPDPACANQVVEGAVMVVTAAGGGAVTRSTSDAQGRFSVDLAPGAYTLVPQPVDGLLGTAAPMDFVVIAGEAPDELGVVYDTGIR